MAAQQLVNKNETDSLANSDEDENQLVVVETRGRGPGNIFEKWMVLGKSNYQLSNAFQSKFLFLKISFLFSLVGQQKELQREYKNYARSKAYFL